jgi:hypothetical protein
MAKLETGEKYLSVVIMQGAIRLVAFPNKNRKKETEPNFKGDGIAVWISTKKAQQPKVTEELI